MECAVWYMRYHACAVEVFDDEQAAVQFAVWGDDAGEHSVIGVQYPDGRAVERAEWAAYAEERRRQDAAADRWIAENRARPKPQMRRVACPFEDRYTARVEIGTPEWVGQAALPA